MEKNLNFYQYSINETLENLRTTKDWITTKEAEERKNFYGKNILKETNKTANWIKFFGQFKDVLIILLAVSMIISLYLQDFRWATILGIIIVINAIIGYIQEAKAEKIMESLKKMINPTAKVKRDGKLIEELAENIVPGDVVFIEEWSNVPADIRIIENNSLQANDFSLTWESSPVSKFTHAIPGDVPLGERNNCLFMGTTIATGYARWVVIATWMETQLGKIANLSQEQTIEDSPIQKEMKNIAKRLTIGTIALCIILLVVALLANFSLKEAFIFAVGIAAAMVPQGLPAQVNIALSLAAGRLAKNKALVKQLASVETLWCVNIICTDKTGTLTKNEMTVKKIFLNNQWFEVTGAWYEPKGQIWLNSIRDTQHITQLLYAWIFASNAKINPPDSEHPNRYCLWDPTEWALITLAKKQGIDTDKLSQDHKQYHQFGFDSIRKMMSSIRDDKGKTMVYVKGAPNELLEHCTTYLDWKGEKKLTPKIRENISKAIDETSQQAMRNIAFAYKEIKKYTNDLSMEEAENNLCFLWFVSIIDPPREEVPAAVGAARNAKIKIIMITWDYWPTAEAIADKIGLDGDGKMKLIWEDELKNMSDIQLISTINKYRSLIFSRTAPEDKLRIVQLLKKTHNVVAVTWDGINDAPALKCADIWVSMWKIWTDVAKEASEIVLMDDSFHTLVYAIKEWRIIYQNLKKTIISCITSNGGELFAVLTSLVLKWLANFPLAINPVQILAIDLIWEMWPLTALTRDPAQKKLMNQYPRNVNDHIMNKYIIIDLIRSGALMGFLGYLGYYLYFILNNSNPSWFDTQSNIYLTATTITYTTIIFCQYMNIISRRAWTTQHIFTSYIRSNKKLLRSFGIGIWIILCLIYIPQISWYFGFGYMKLIDWLFPIIGWITFLGIREWYKYLVKKFKKIKE